LAVGRFLGHTGADVIVGARLLPSGDPTRSFDVPVLAETAAKLDGVGFEAADLSGDPTAAYVDGVTWLAYATSSGTVVRRITLDAQGKPGIEEPTIVPETANAQPTLASWHRHLALLLWRSPHEPIGVRLLSIEDAKLNIQDEDKLPIHSLAPVAAVPGADDPKHPSLWIARLEGQLPDRLYHTEVVRWVPEGHRRYRHAERNWIGGLYWYGSELKPFEKHSAHRMALAWEPEHGLGPQGRLYHFCGAETTAERPWSEPYVAMQVADRTFGGGWMTRRYAPVDLTSRSAPGVCWFRGDLVYCLRQHSDDPQTNDHLTLSFHGAGIQADLMSDFNDIDWICRIGLSHGLPGVVEVGPR
jgi:hypothetical protein